MRVVLLLALAGFLVGGAYAFREQGKPGSVVLLLAVCAFVAFAAGVLVA